MKTLNLLIVLLLGVGFISCKNRKDNTTSKISVIDSTLQFKSTSILKEKLSELKALSGQAIKLMEVQIKLF